MDTSIADQIAVAHAAIDRVLSNLTSTEITGQTVKRLRGLLDRVDLGITFAYNQYRNTGDYLLDGYPTAPAWLAANTNALRSEGHARKEHAELLDLLGSFGDAFHGGRIGYAHIRILAPAVTSDRRPLAVRDEAVLLEAAEALTPSEFKIAVRKWVSLCDDELSDPTKPDTYSARRRVTLTVLPDGTWKLDGILEPLAGETLAAAFAAVMPSKRLPDDDRTVVQKRHDALHDMAREILGNEDLSEVHGSPPNVTVVVNGENGNTTTASGTVLPRWVRDAMCCDATFTAVFMSGKGVPFDVGTPITGIPQRTRKAILARDCQCRYKGCNRPPRGSHIHHIKPREDGGTNTMPKDRGPRLRCASAPTNRAVNLVSELRSLASAHSLRYRRRPITSNRPTHPHAISEHTSTHAGRTNPASAQTRHRIWQWPRGPNHAPRIRIARPVRTASYACKIVAERPWPTLLKDLARSARWCFALLGELLEVTGELEELGVDGVDR